MIAYAILAVYLIGIWPVARAALAVLLEHPVCLRFYHDSPCGPSCLVPYGEVRGRDGHVIRFACGAGVFWPLLLLPYLLMKRAPLTDGERVRQAQLLEAAHGRRAAEMQAEIDKLNRQLGARR